MIAIQYGWNAPPISEQFPELDSGDAERFQDHMKAIMRLYIHGLLTASEKDKAIRRMLKELDVLVMKARGLK